MPEVSKEKPDYIMTIKINNKLISLQRTQAVHSSSKTSFEIFKIDIAMRMNVDTMPSITNLF